VGGATPSRSTGALDLWIRRSGGNVERVSRALARFGALGLAAAYAAWIGVSLLLLPPVALLKDPRRSFTITVKDWNRKGRPVHRPNLLRSDPRRACSFDGLEEHVAGGEDGDRHGPGPGRIRRRSQPGHGRRRRLNHTVRRVPSRRREDAR
jgi:hypothetical protein